MTGPSATSGPSSEPKLSSLLQHKRSVMSMSWDSSSSAWEGGEARGR